MLVEFLHQLIAALLIILSRFAIYNSLCLPSRYTKLIVLRTCYVIPYIFLNTFQFLETYYLLPSLRIILSSFCILSFFAMYIKPSHLKILLRRVSLFTPFYHLLLSISFHQLYHHTLHERNFVSLYVFPSPGIH